MATFINYDVMIGWPGVLQGRIQDFLIEGCYEPHSHVGVVEVLYCNTLLLHRITGERPLGLSHRSIVKVKRGGVGGSPPSPPPPPPPPTGSSP